MNSLKPRGDERLLAVERRKRIRMQLLDEKRVHVSELSAAYSVSEETIRRDLERLETEGLVSRTYGGAVLREDGRDLLRRHSRRVFPVA